MTYLIALPIAFAYGDVHLAAFERWWPYFLAGGLATAINGALLLLVYRYMDAAMGSLLMTTNVVVTVLAAMYVLGERMGLHELIGTALVLAAVVYVLAVHVGKKERRNWTMGILVTCASTVFFAVAVVIEKFLLGEVGASSYLVWGWGCQATIAVLLGLCFGGRQFAVVLARRNAPLVFGAGVARAGFGLGFVFSLVLLKSLCLAIILAGLRPLFVSFLGAWLLKERKFLARKVIASVVAGIGVAIMLW
jgi:drug/metabolite transporter (DMT)-like permease